MHKNFRIDRDTDGATAIEFALIAPVLFLMVMGIIEFGMIMFASATLEGATNIGARLGKSGATTSGMTREQYIRTEIQNRASGLLNPAQVVITTRPYPTFSTTGNPPPEPCITAQCGNGAAGVDYSDLNGNGSYDLVRTDAGLGGDVVVYDVTYNWPLFTPMISQLIGSGGSYQVRAVTTVRNEPF